MEEITIKDIARICGVGVSTVSRAINNHPDINPETKEMIMRVIKENNYVPNNSARNLKRQDAKAIAVLVKGINNSFFSQMIKVLEEEIKEKSYAMVLQHVDYDEDEVEVALKLVKEKRLRGIIFLGGYLVHSEGRKKPQYLGFVQENSLLAYHPKSHVKVAARFLPEEDGLTFHLKAVFTDSLHTTISDEHSSTFPEITRICGPVQKVNDTTFTVRFYRMGMYNKRRTGDICLLASHDGDNQYKSTVQELSFRIPYRNTEGKRQYILFPGIGDVKAGVESVTLRATSDCGLPVYYYVKEGPAEIDGNKLVFTPIPPRSKYPLKETVDARQYGLAGKGQTAEPIERSFFIYQ